jgi:hypothetical protein
VFEDKTTWRPAKSETRGETCKCEAKIVINMPPTIQSQEKKRAEEGRR